jgi:hypothetical protein
MLARIGMMRALNRGKVPERRRKAAKAYRIIRSDIELHHNHIRSNVHRDLVAGVGCVSNAPSRIKDALTELGAPGQ